MGSLKPVEILAQNTKEMARKSGIFLKDTTIYELFKTIQGQPETAGKAVNRNRQRKPKITREGKVAMDKANLG